MKCCPRGDGYATDASFFDCAGNKSRRFYFLDEFAQIRCTRIAAFGNSERLLNRHKSTLEHARSWKLLGISDEMLSHTGDNIDFARNNQLER